MLGCETLGTMCLLCPLGPVSCCQQRALEEPVRHSSCLVPPTLGLVAAPAVATSVIPRYRRTFAVDQTSLNQVLPLGSLRPGDCCVDDTTRPVASGFKLGMGGAESRSSHRPRRGAARPDSWSGGLLGTCLNMLLYFCSREKGKARGPYQQAAWGRQRKKDA